MGIPSGSSQEHSRMREEVKAQLIEWAGIYNDLAYFSEDPIQFPREFVRRGAALQDIEIAAIFAAHLAWGCSSRWIGNRTTM